MTSYRPRFKNYVGFVSAPASFDFSLQQFLDVCGDEVGVVQHMAHYPDADYGSRVHDGPRRLEFLKDGIAGLRDAGARVVAQCGGYWSLSYVPDLATARELEQSLSNEFGVQVILNWTAIVDALRSFDVSRISVATGYYRPAWTEASVAFLESAGFEVLWAGDLIDQGILPDEEAKLEIEAATMWDYPDELVQAACVEAAKLAPDCDAVCQTGAGMRLNYVVESVESETGKPLVSTDLAIYWAVLRAAGLNGEPGNGRLIASASG